MKPDESSIQIPFFLTAAVRSWLINRLLDPQDIAEVRYLLFELGYQDLPESVDMIDFLKIEMSRLNNGNSQSRHTLIRLCEGIIQFYLLRHPRKTPELDQFNSFLPPGFSFSAVTSRLVFEPDFFYQDHNLFIEEQAHWYLPDQNRVQEAEAFFPLPQDQSSPESFINAVSNNKADDFEYSNVPSSNEPSGLSEVADTLDNPCAEVSPRAQRFKTIRNQRLQLLKQWEQIP